MKVVCTVLKILTALAAVAGAVYVVATYGDQIVAWAKKLLKSCPCKCCGTDAVEAPVEEAAAPAEEAPVEEPAPEEAPAVDVPAEDGTVVADDTDFEG